MKFLQLVFFLNLVLALNSCQQKNNTVDESEANADEAVETTNDLTSSEEESPVISEDSIVEFYNKVLGGLYPNRTISVQYEDRPIAVSPNALENVEGGGESRKYLRVVDEIDFEIGTIIYETRSSPYPITLSMAILEEGYSLAFSMLTEINGSTVLRVSSNDSGNLDMGPYDFNYFSYAELVNLQPILTKKMVENEPDLSPKDKESAIKNISREEYDQGSRFSQDEIMEIFEGVF